MSQTILARYLSAERPYQPMWQAMQDFSQNRQPETADQIWFCQHQPVFTLGRQGRTEHILQKSDIPIIQTDRGGHVTYHGPGQLMIYLLLDLKRRQLGAKKLVCSIEQALINLLNEYHISAQRRDGAPGIYVDQAKIASVGLRIKQSKTYHGICLNVDADLSPFELIDPCGYKNLKMTQLSDYGPPPKLLDLSNSFMAHFCSLLHCDWQADGTEN